MQEHDALERELKELIAFEERGVDVSPGGKWSKMDKKAIKARVRMIKNRLAAKRSREHARTYVQELEGTLETLQSKNEALARRLAAVEAENNKLRRLEGLEAGNGGRTDEEEDKDHNKPAVLYTSQQLDAVLFFFLSALLSPLTPSPPSPPSPSPALCGGSLPPAPQRDALCGPFVQAPPRHPTAPSTGLRRAFQPLGRRRHPAPMAAAAA